MEEECVGIYQRQAGYVEAGEALIKGLYLVLDPALDWVQWIRHKFQLDASVRVLGNHPQSG